MAALPHPSPFVFSRRRFLQIAGLSAAGLFLPKGLIGAKPEDFLTVSLLHTTDLHSHILPTVSYDGLPDVGGLARCASQIRMWRRQNPNSITVDAGDVYQGTEFGYRTRGRKMIECFNLLNYDAWVLGNHEFDWGIEAVHNAVAASQVPVLTANARTDGDAWKNISPWICQELDGFRIGVVGVTTPGLPYWFRPEFLRGFDVTDPLEPMKSALHELREAKADAIVLVGHMGLRTGGDDFANRTEGLLQAYPEIVAFIGGHTHRDVPDQSVHGRPFTQASYHGIHCGKLDLVFEKAGRKLVGVHPTTTLMDHRVGLDAAVVDLTADSLEESSVALAQPVGILGQTLSVESQPGKPSELEEFFGAAIMEGLASRKVIVDGVFHGMFWPDGPVPAGPKNLADIWKILPYENYLVVSTLTTGQLRSILEENYGTRGFRSLMGLQVSVEGRGASRRVVSIRRGDGSPLEAGETVRIAFNSFDAQSAGQRLMKLRQILSEEPTRTSLVDLQTRSAVIEYFQSRDIVTLPGYEANV